MGKFRKGETVRSASLLSQHVEARAFPCAPTTLECPLRFAQGPAYTPWLDGFRHVRLER